MIAAPRAALPVALDPPALPPDGFDPVGNDADAARLPEFWLPDRPDRVTEPELYLHWAEMMRAPLRFVLAGGAPHKPFLHSRPPPRPLSRTRVVDSRNWSGAVTVPHMGGRFTRVAGKWTVPALTPGPDPDPAGIGEQAATIWIGLDGSAPWSKGMPQLGSAHHLDAQGARRDYLWFQWWLRDGPSSERPIAAVPIGPGDDIYANISVLGPFEALLHLANRTTKTFTTVKLLVADPAGCTFPIQGASAEWVLERPADAALATDPAPNGPLYPLPDYGSLAITRCATRMDNGVPSGWVPLLLCMAEIVPDSRKVYRSVPRRRGEPGQGIRLQYRG